MACYRAMMFPYCTNATDLVCWYHYICAVGSPSSTGKCREHHRSADQRGERCAGQQHPLDRRTWCVRCHHRLYLGSPGTCAVSPPEPSTEAECWCDCGPRVLCAKRIDFGLCFTKAVQCTMCVHTLCSCDFWRCMTGRRRLG